LTAQGGPSCAHRPFPVPNVYVDKGFLVYEEDAGGQEENIYFVRLLSAAMEISQKVWVIRGLPACAARGHQRAIHPPLDLLVIPVVYVEGA